MIKQILIDEDKLKLALKELETWKRFTHGENEHTNKAIKVLEEALAKQEQSTECVGEPVAWFKQTDQFVWQQCYPTDDGATPLCHPHPKREPLTDEQIKSALWEAYKADLEAQGIDTQGMDFNQWYSPSHLFYAKAAIEAAHGIKE